MKQRVKRLSALWLAVLLLVSALVMPASAYDTVWANCWFTTDEIVSDDYIPAGSYWVGDRLWYGDDAPSIDEFLEANGITEDNMMLDGELPTGWRIWTDCSSGYVPQDSETFDLECGESITQEMYDSLLRWQWHSICIQALYGDTLSEALGGVLFLEYKGDIHFVDIAESAWYYDAVSNAASNGWMKGVSPTHFAPDANLTRAMIWTILARANGQRTDGDGAWYGIGRQWAMRTGISDGTNPDATLTQEELLTMVWRSIGSPYCVADVAGSDVSDWAIEAVRWAIDCGIVSASFAPKAPATRAWTAHVMMLA